jgi:hypothetical protein
MGSTLIVPKLFSASQQQGGSGSYPRAGRRCLDLSKIEASKLELNPESVNLAPLIDEVTKGRKRRRLD